MPEQVISFNINIFNGLNENDQANELVPRAYQQGQAGMQQVSPVESPNLKNIDFSSDGLAKRRGSTESDDLTGVTVVGEELIAGTFFRVHNSVQKPNLIVGKKSIYINTTGTWAQITNANGTAYVHSNDVSKVTFTLLDQRVFIGLDGDNAIQVYRSGSALDNHLHATTTTTVVDASSSSGQKVLNVSDTTIFEVGDRIKINASEVGYVDTVQAGISITLEDNLASTYTNEAVIVENLYYTANTSTTNALTGNIGTGYFLVASSKSRLIYCDGSVVVNYSDVATSGVYKFADSGFFQASSRVRAVTAFAPYYTDSINENIYIGTELGWEIRTDIATGAVIKVEGSRPPFNHQSFTATKRWIVYLTSDKNIFAINGTTVIDLGRRLKTTSRDGTLDGLDISSSQDTAFAHYYADREQVYIHYTNDSSGFNDICIVIDFRLDEPNLGENKRQFEQRVRLLKWTISAPATNDWFSYIYRNETATVGVTKAGKTYQLDLGSNDLGTLAVESEYYTPIFFAGNESISKQFLDIYFRGINTGDFDVNYSIFVDRSNTAIQTGTFSVGTANSVYGTATYGTGTYASTAAIRNTDDIDLYHESIQWFISNTELSETFKITTTGIRFLFGAEER